jgi:CheY-like chemotaxis protein
MFPWWGMVCPAVVHTIVFVDDSDDDLYLIRRLAVRAGLLHAYVCFNEPSKVKAYLEDEEREGRCPCLLVTDVKMPECSGFDLIVWIKARKGLSHMRTIALSGANVPEDRIRAEEMNTRYIQKYPTTLDFRSLIAEVCTYETHDRSASAS